MTYEDRHGRYLIETTNDESASDVLDRVPNRIGDSRHGNILTEIRLEKVSRMLWVASLTVDPVK